jgi:hypothetical protein
MIERQIRLRCCTRLRYETISARACSVFIYLIHPYPLFGRLGENTTSSCDLEGEKSDRGVIACGGEDGDPRKCLEASCRRLAAPNLSPALKNSLTTSNHLEGSAGWACVNPLLLAERYSSCCCCKADQRSNKERSSLLHHEPSDRTMHFPCEQREKRSHLFLIT